MPFNTVNGRNYRFSVDRFSSNVIIRLFSCRRWESFNSSNSLARPPFNAFNRAAATAATAAAMQSNNSQMAGRVLHYFIFIVHLMHSRTESPNERQKEWRRRWRRKIQYRKTIMHWDDPKEKKSFPMLSTAIANTLHGENITLTIKERVCMLAYMSLCWRTAKI